MQNTLTNTWTNTSGAILGFIHTKIKDKEASKDILQEVFIKAYEQIDKLKDEEKITSWLYSITRNEINNYYRKEQKESKSRENIQFLNIEDDSQLSEWITMFEKCFPHLMDDMPEKYRTPLIMSDLKSKNQQDIADELGISYSGAKSRVQRGRQKLKELIKECCNIEINKSGQFVSGNLEMEHCSKCNS